MGQCPRASPFAHRDDRSAEALWSLSPRGDRHPRPHLDCPDRDSPSGRGSSPPARPQGPLDFESTPIRSVPGMITAQHKIGSGFGAKSTAEDVLDGIDLTGKLAVVTGGYSGLGLETTRALTKAGARVVVPARRRVTAEEALAGLGGVEVDELDLGDLESVRGFAERFLDSGRNIDIVIDNAGIMACPETQVGPAGRRSSPPTTSATSPWSTACGRRSRPAVPGSSPCPPAPTTSPACAGTTSTGGRATTSGRPTARPRPRTSSSPSTSTSSPARRVSAPSRCTPAASSRPSNGTSPRRR